MRAIQCSIVIPVFFTFLFMAALANDQQVLGEEKQKEVAGKADVLRHVPKKFATLTSVDIDSRQVELLIEDENEPRVWDLNPDAELKVRGWWGHLEQFQIDDRVWVWFAVDRNKDPKSILMLADELSQQIIHQLPLTLKSVDDQGKTVTLQSDADGERQLQLVGTALELSDRLDKKLFVQSSGKTARIVATEKQLEAMRNQQKEWLREKWRSDGLPGTVSFLHPLAGEADIILDHQAIRWGRFLKNGDEVTITTPKPIQAVVKRISAWRERTQLRLVTNSGVDQADLLIGQRIGLRVPEPPSKIQASSLPTDIGRLESKQERVDWFLASVYCPCKIAGDRCTGMFYTLSSCNVNACGMPNKVRGELRQLIDEGKNDEQIWNELQKLHGTPIVVQHLLR